MQRVTTIERSPHLASRFRPFVIPSVITVLFLCALGVRLYGIQGSLFDFHPVKQFRSALTARAIYYDQPSVAVPEWRRTLSQEALSQIDTLVPPFLDWAAALAYRAADREVLWVPRLLSALCWIVGGLFLLGIATRIMIVEAAIFSLAFYLLLPFSVIASQSFQPDSVMVMLSLMGLLGIVRYDARPSRSRLLLAALISSLAVLSKPVSLPILLAAFLALEVSRSGVRGAISSPDAIAYVTIAILPSAIFYGYHVFFTSGALQIQAEKSFVPALFLEFRFWDGWLKRIRLVTGFTYFLAGLFGTLLFAAGRARHLIVGLWAGYFLMCIAFNYTISTHDYYHLPLIPIVALSLGSIVMAAWPTIVRATKSWPARLAFVGLTGAAVFLIVGTSVQARRRLPVDEESALSARRIGDAVSHSSRTIHLAPYQGFPLMYHAEIAGKYWPYWYDIRDEELWSTRPLSAEERLRQMTRDFPAEYFIVADLDELDRQEDLKELLHGRFEILVESEDFVIFDMNVEAASALSGAPPITNRSR